MRKNLIHTAVLSGLLFMLGWLLAPLIVVEFAEHCIAIGTNVEFIALDVQGAYRVSLMAAVSLALVPAVAFTVMNFTRHKIPITDSVKRLYKLFSILLICYIAGAAAKYGFLHLIVLDLNTYSIEPGVKNQLPIGQLIFHDFAAIATLIGALALLIVSLLKRKVA